MGKEDVAKEREAEETRYADGLEKFWQANGSVGQKPNFLEQASQALQKQDNKIVVKLSDALLKDLEQKRGQQKKVDTKQEIDMSKANAILMAEKLLETFGIKFIDRNFDELSSATSQGCDKDKLLSILIRDFNKQEAGKVVMDLEARSGGQLHDDAYKAQTLDMGKLQKDVDSFAQSFPLSKEATISQELTNKLVIDFAKKHGNFKISPKEKAEFAKIADGIVNKLGADSIESNFDLVTKSTIKTIEKSKTFTSRVLHALGISPNTVEKLVDKTVGTVEKAWNPVISNLTKAYKNSGVENAMAMAKKDVRNLGMVKVNEELGRVKDSKAMAKQVVENLGVVKVNEELGREARAVPAKAKESWEERGRPPPRTRKQEEQKGRSIP